MNNPIDILIAKAKAKQAAITAKKMDLLSWGKKYVPHYLTREFCQAHYALGNELDRLDTERDQKACIIIPRGYAKSTIASFLKPLKAVCEATERYILIGSKTEDQGCKYLSSIKEELETNTLLKRDYPSACTKGGVWNTQRIETGNNVCLEVFGKGTGVRGRKYRQFRPSLIICDDLQENEDVISPTIRSNDIQWYTRSLIPCGDKGTNIFLIGNNLHQESIVAYCSSKPDYKVIRFSAIEVMPTNMHLWDEWEQRYMYCRNDADRDALNAYYAENKEAMDLGVKLLWEEKESLYELMCLRASIGHAAFDAEKQNNPRDPSKCEFPEEWFTTDSVWYDTLPKDIGSIRVGFNDPSKGKQNKRRDYSPIITLHFYPSLKKCYLECDVRRIPVTQLTDSIIEWHKQVNYDVFGIESNGFQELIADELNAKLLDKGIVLPISAIENYGVNKNVRISRLSIWLQRGFFIFKRGCPYTALLVKYLMQHPFADHDDPPDALEGGLRVLTMVSNLDNIEEIIDTNDDGLGENLCDMLY